MLHTRNKHFSYFNNKESRRMHQQQPTAASAKDDMLAYSILGYINLAG
jgi:hypothetical protein